ncbi:S26 family signal peptidase [Rhizobium sp. LC145]|uniref:S26 family signal peptidase n=1 Tax=Rhizobium sp. LC145 TaxID=1120688 RepID=UPI000629E478|nr:S26 family signal peptidase [Rhizobium sp. LC145]KKX29401.1 peptidase [Rhizobium sp. LC145]MDX3927935.1 S26 family signal peptidase [Shinella sp.]TKT69015.1 S26 family signal peptidase [Rhizobiaceae bacterium LC148]
MTARGGTLAVMLAGAALIVVPEWSRPDFRFIWNASGSVPVGLYRIERGGALLIGDLAVVVPPDELADFLDERGYLPKGLPLLKRVLALVGTTVCRNGTVISAYGMTYGQARERDGQDRPLPIWQGCRKVAEGEAFFMNWDSSDSFDGRYFGPLQLSTVVGRAVPLWTTDDPDPVADSFREPVSDEP